MNRAIAIVTGCLVLALGLHLRPGGFSEKESKDRESISSGGMSFRRVSRGNRSDEQPERIAPDGDMSAEGEMEGPVGETQEEAGEEEASSFWGGAVDTAETVSDEECVSLDEFDRPYMLTLNEEDFFKLSPEDQERLFSEISEDLRGMRRDALDALERAQSDMDCGQYARAEAALTAQIESASELTANKEGLNVTRLVGISLQQGALKKMETLYDGTNDRVKLEQTRRHWQDLEAEKDAMRG